MKPFHAVFGTSLAPALLEELGAMSLTRAVPVQEQAIPLLLTGRSAVVVAPTGSGKTLAYALPLVELLRREAASVPLRVSRPRALVVVPSRELCVQVAQVVKRLAKGVGRMRVEALVGGAAGTARTTKRHVIDERVDAIVCTPGVLLKLRTAERIYTSDVRRVVFDEADTLFAPSFESDIEALLLPIRGMGLKRGEARQYVAVAATLTQSQERRVARAFGASPAVVRVEGTHHVPPTLQEQWVRVATGDKMPALVEALEEHPWRKCLVFVNGADCARAVEYHLRERGVQGVHSFHAQVPAEQRRQFFRAFVAGGDCRVLVCSDAASRGLDLQGVDLVVSYDFPPSVADYIHRVGRTARMGAQGRCVSLIQTKRDRALAALIQQDRDMTHALEQVAPEAPRVAKRQ